MLVYFDSNALVKLILDEPGSDLAVSLFEGATVVTSIVTYAEVRAALAGARRLGRLPARALGRAKNIWEATWASTKRVGATDDIVHAAGELCESYALRGFDAIHLASALTLVRDRVIVASWDRRVRAGAAALKLGVAPATI